VQIPVPKLLPLLSIFFTSLTHAAELPNILWLTSEDNGPQLGCYGDKYAVTPNIDALAAKGLRYLYASSNAPVCAPARTTIISGLYPPSTGSEHMRSMVKLPETFKMYPQFLREAGYYCTNKTKEDFNLEKPGQLWDTGKNGPWNDRKEGQPFFSIINYGISHESQIRNQIAARDKIHDPDKAPIPAYHPDVPEVRANWAQYYDRMTQMDSQIGQSLKELENAGLAEDTILFYYGDHGSGMPRSKRWPYNSGLQVPMVVRFPQKWAHLAPKDYKVGGASERLVSFVDLAPTLLSIAGIKPPEWMQGHAFAGSFQTEEPEYSYGFRGRMDERYDMVRVVRSKHYIYIRNYMPHRIYGQHIQYMFATPTTSVWQRMFKEGKLNAAQSHFWKTKPAEELYDLQNDPDEVKNLSHSPQQQDVLAKMRKAQEDWARRIKDVGFLSEYEFHARSKGGAPYDMGHDPKRYDFESIFAAAQLATSLTESDLPKIAELLDSKDSGVRYWGTLGLLTQGKKGIAAGYDRLITALKDESQIVQITAAEALGRYGNDDDAAVALDVLIKHAMPKSDVFAALAAWNAIDYLDERASPAAEKLVALSPKPEGPANRIEKYSSRVKEKVMADLGSQWKPATKKK